MQNTLRDFSFHKPAQALAIDYSLKSQHEAWEGAYTAYIISLASLEHGLILIMHFFLIVQKSKKSIIVLGPLYTKADASGFAAAVQSTAGYKHILDTC